MGDEEKLEFQECCYSWCCLCRHSIAGSSGFFGRGLKNLITNKTHYYCFKCYSLACEMYVAELKVIETEKRVKEKL